MTASSVNSATPDAPRGWRSLLTGRWHRSSWVVAVLVLLFLVFCNVPGQLVSDIDVNHYSYDADLLRATIHVQEHGWPFAWARRDGDLLFIDNLSCWKPWNNQPIFSFGVLPLNGLIALIVALTAGMLFESWRRTRARLSQIHLRDALALIFIVSLVGAWYADQQRRFAHENRILRDHYTGRHDHWEPDRPGGIMSKQRKHGGVTWLRNLIGDRHFQFLDRVIAVRADGAGLKWAAELPDVQLVQVSKEFNSDCLRHLERMGRLEVLDVNSEDRWFFILHPNSRPQPTELTMPRLPRLRWLRATNVSCVGLARTPLLENLDFRMVKVNEPLLCDIAFLSALRRLSLADCKLPNESTERLASLTRLESLDLQETNVTDDAMEHLGAFKKLRELNLSKTRVTARAHPHFAQMKQLRDLSLPGSGFSDEDRRRLTAELPDCHISWTR